MQYHWTTRGLNIWILARFSYEKRWRRSAPLSLHRRNRSVHKPIIMNDVKGIYRNWASLIPYLHVRPTSSSFRYPSILAKGLWFLLPRRWVHTQRVSILVSNSKFKGALCCTYVLQETVLLRRVLINWIESVMVQWPVRNIIALKRRLIWLVRLFPAIDVVKTRIQIDPKYKPFGCVEHLLNVTAR